MKTITDLGLDLRSLRRAAGLTQTDLAARAGLRQEALSRFERGRSPDFSLAKLLRLAQALGRDLRFAPAADRPTLDDVLKERQKPVELPKAPR